MPALNLLTDPWLPVRRRSGPALIRLAQLTEALADDPVLASDWPRPDFRIASLEFLIGLLALAIPPADATAWLDQWHTPPSPEALQAALDPLAPCFVLDGEGPRFLQDLEDLPGEAEDPAMLLMDRAADQGLFVKPGPALHLGRATAAIALYTLQAWAPEGGRGHYTGLRGGGPLVTLARPEGEASLWHLLWANTSCGARPERADWPRIMPWLAPTITGEKERFVRPAENAHPLQAFWGMPRRIRLDVTPVPGGRCGITGAADDVLVTGRRQRPNGARYASWGRAHPLTPYRREKPDSGEWFSIKPQPGGIGYRHWLGLTVDRAGSGMAPARAITDWRERRPDTGAGPDTRLLAAGYDMKQMKARAFVEQEMPLPGGDAPTEARLAELAERLVRAADDAADLLRRALRLALFGPASKVALDASLLALGRERLWERTDAAFFATLTAAREDAEAEPLQCVAWITLLRRTALAVFDAMAPMPMDGGTATRRHAAARRDLNATLSGRGRNGARIFGELGLEAPAPRAKETA